MGSSGGGRLDPLGGWDARSAGMAEGLLRDLVRRSGARKGALLLESGGDDERVVATLGTAAGMPDDLEFSDLEAGVLSGPESSVVRLQEGRAVLVPLRAVVRDEEEAPSRRRRRFDLPPLSHTLGWVYLEGEGLRPPEEEIRLASTLGTLLLAARWGGHDEPRCEPLLQSTLEDEARVAELTSIPLAVGLLEVHGWTSLLETEGPAEAEERLRRGLRAARRSLRSTDRLVRSGSCTAGLILPATDGEGGEQAVLKATRALEAELDVRLRWGLAVAPRERVGAKALLELAAERLRGEAEEEDDEEARPVHLMEAEDLPRILGALEGLETLSVRGGDRALLGAVTRAAGAEAGAIFQVEDGKARVLERVGTLEGQEERAREVTASGYRREEDEARWLGWRLRGGGRVLLLRVPAASGPLVEKLAETVLRCRGVLVASGRKGAEELSSLSGIVGTSAAMRSVLERILKVRGSDVTVLLVGETGTGKELLARAIHEGSDRSSGPFVTVDCGSLPASLADAELFGHRKGAFTDATTERRGLIEAADGGTLFLDEVTSMGLELQPRLLRFLQEGEVRRVGETEYREVDVRVVAASNHDPKREVESGAFRLDLYHRLQGVQVDIPPLRERREDVPSLARHFLRRFAGEEGVGPLTLSSEVLEILMAHDWPGNVRELENTLRSALLVAGGGELRPEHLPRSVGQSDESGEPAMPRTNEELKVAKERAIARISRSFLRRALAEAEGNVSRAARATGLQRTYFHRLLRDYQVDADEFRQD